MNAPTTHAQLKPELRLVSIEHLVPSHSQVQQLRRSRFTKEDTKRLADDIARNGLIQHPVVRPLTGDGADALVKAGRPTFEIVAGERRWLAAKVAGLKEIYVSVRELTDEQALEAQLSENLQRKDLHELEEAEGYEELMKLKKLKSAEDLVDLVGQSRSYIYARLKLLALCPEARKAFYAGEIDASKALLVARIGHHDTQRQALADITKGLRHHNSGPMSFREAHKHIVESYMLQLKRAPFDVKDANLVPKAGTCEACPKRTGNQRDLFSDVKNADVCTDPKCFDDKRQAHFAAPRKALEAKGKKVIYGDDAKKLYPDWDSPNDWSRTRMNTTQYVKLDETTYSVSPCRKVGDLLGADYEPVLIQHPGTGQIIRVATQQAIAAAAAAKARAKPDRQKSSPSRPAQGQSGDKAADLKEKIKDATEARIFAALNAKITTLGTVELLQIVHRFVISDADTTVVGAAMGWKVANGNQFEKKARSLKVDKLLKLVYLLFVSDEMGFGMGGEKVLLDAARRYKIKPEAIEKEVREALTPKPVDKVNAAIDARAWEKLRKLSTGSTNFMKPVIASPQLAPIVGALPIVRTEVTKKIWGYIKRNGLQDKKNRRMINADAKLLPIFGKKKQVSMFDMTKALTAHLRLAPAGTTVAKKAKGKKK